MRNEWLSALHPRRGWVLGLWLVVAPMVPRSGSDVAWAAGDADASLSQPSQAGKTEWTKPGAVQTGKRDLPKDVQSILDYYQKTLPARIATTPKEFRSRKEPGGPPHTWQELQKAWQDLQGEIGRMMVIWEFGTMPPPKTDDGRFDIGELRAQFLKGAKHLAMVDPVGKHYLDLWREWVDRFPGTLPEKLLEDVIGIGENGFERELKVFPDTFKDFFPPTAANASAPPTRVLGPWQEYKAARFQAIMELAVRTEMAKLLLSERKKN